eukprot:1389650-Rhodomonas_salina.1
MSRPGTAERYGGDCYLPQNLFLHLLCNPAADPWHVEVDLENFGGPVANFLQNLQAPNAVCVELDGGNGPVFELKEDGTGRRFAFVVAEGPEHDVVLEPGVDDRLVHALELAVVEVELGLALLFAQRLPILVLRDRILEHRVQVERADQRLCDKGVFDRRPLHQRNQCRHHLGLQLSTLIMVLSRVQHAVVLDVRAANDAVDRFQQRCVHDRVDVAPARTLQKLGDGREPIRRNLDVERRQALLDVDHEGRDGSDQVDSVLRVWLPPQQILHVEKMPFAQVLEKAEHILDLAVVRVRRVLAMLRALGGDARAESLGSPLSSSPALRPPQLRCAGEARGGNSPRVPA